MFVFYVGHKLWTKSKIVPIMEVPIQQFIDIADANPEPEPTPSKGLRTWFAKFWWQ